MQAKSERFEMRLDQNDIDRVEAWRARQPDLPSRAEAVRRLMDIGLISSAHKPLSVSDGEKIILLALRDIFRHQRIKGEADLNFVQEALCSGQAWALRWHFSGLLHETDVPEHTLTEVLDVLSMWDCLEWSYEKLAKKEKDRVSSALNRSHDVVTFPGFDGNKEGEHFGIARFLTKHLDRFPRFKDRDLNSHWPHLGSYRRMLAVFEPKSHKLARGVLSATDVIDIMQAGM